MNLMSYTSLEDFTKIPKNQDIDGAKLYSMVIPDRVNLTTSALKIKKGNITEGRVTTKNLGFKGLRSPFRSRHVFLVNRVTCRPICGSYHIKTDVS